jgi:hypothetical protein
MHHGFNLVRFHRIKQSGEITHITAHQFGLACPAFEIDERAAGLGIKKDDFFAALDECLFRLVRRTRCISWSKRL